MTEKLERTEKGRIARIEGECKRRGIDGKNHEKLNKKALPVDFGRLISAVKRGDLVLVRKLLDEGASMNADDERGDSALHLAVQQGNWKMIDLLATRGANLEAEDRYGKQPLYRATVCGTDEIVYLLLQRGANLESEDKYGRRPLHAAAMYGKPDILRLLLQKGAKKEATDNGGFRPLHLAALNGFEKSIHILLDMGAHILPTNNYGRTSLHLAADSSALAVVQTLLAQPSKKFGVGGKRAFVNAKDKEGNTALHLAYKRKEMDIVDLLEKNGADGSIKNKKGKTPAGEQQMFQFDNISSSD